MDLHGDEEIGKRKNFRGRGKGKGGFERVRGRGGFGRGRGRGGFERGRGRGQTSQNGIHENAKIETDEGKNDFSSFPLSRSQSNVSLASSTIGSGWSDYDVKSSSEDETEYQRNSSLRLGKDSVNRDGLADADANRGGQRGRAGFHRGKGRGGSGRGRGRGGSGRGRGGEQNVQNGRHDIARRETGEGRGGFRRRARSRRRPWGQGSNDGSHRNVTSEREEREERQPSVPLSRTSSVVSLASSTVRTDFDGSSSEDIDEEWQRKSRQTNRRRHKSLRSRTGEKKGAFDVYDGHERIEYFLQGNVKVDDLLASIKNLGSEVTSIKEGQGGPSKQRQKATCKADGYEYESSSSAELQTPNTFRKVYDILLNKFCGRAEFSKLLTDNDLPKKAAEVSWYKQNKKKFLLFEDNGDVKFVSVFSAHARLCIKYNKDGCTDDDCKYLHICVRFVTGDCKQSCCLSHDFFDNRNNNCIQELGLDVFKNEEVAKIVRCSLPEWCEEYQSQGDRHVKSCPLIHVCRNEFCTKHCRLEHSVKGSAHNRWVLKVYHMEKGYEQVLRRMLLQGGNGQSKQSIEGVESEVKEKKPSEVKLKGIIKKSSFASADCNLLKLESSTGRRQAKEQQQHALGVKSETEAINSNVLMDIGKTKTRCIKTDVTESSYSFKFESDDDEHMGTAKPLGSCKFYVLDGIGRIRSPKSSSHLQNYKSTIAVESRNSAQGKVEEKLQKFHVDEIRSADLVTQDSRQRVKPLIGLDLDSESDSHTLDVTSDTVLCEKYVWGECSKCSHFHGVSSLPYQWQIHMHDGWVLFEPQDNEKIEMAFCRFDKKIDGVKISEYMMSKIDFDAMTATTYISLTHSYGESEPLDVRRLSTPSYVKGTDENMTELTQWCWYFRDHDSWYPFEPGTLQYTLELKYQSDQKTYLFEREPFEYEINFSDMIQTNLKTQKRRVILRRPMLVTSEDVCKKKKISHLNLLSRKPSLSMPLPPGWLPLDCHQPVELVQIPLDGNETVKTIEDLFFATMKRSTVKMRALFRIQNPSLWEKYCSTKRGMELRPHAGSVSEKQLFHGTDDDKKVIRGICHNNVDFRLSGKNGTVYGEGAYFARDARYSHNYTRGAVRFMFLCRVLVGQYAKGESSYKRPPIRAGHSLYDSCVDNVTDPKIYVVFDLTQSYPEFLIEYEVTQSPDTGSSYTHASLPSHTPTRPQPTPLLASSNTLPLAPGVTQARVSNSRSGYTSAGTSGYTKRTSLGQPSPQQEKHTCIVQ